MDRLTDVSQPRRGDPPAEIRPAYILGLDLGQSQDFSALTLDEIHGRGTKGSRHLIRYLRRWKLGTPYPAIVADVAALVKRPPIGRSDSLVVDATGVGPPVVDMFRDEHLPIHLVPVLITAGHEATEQDDKSWHVPKRDLVSTITVLLQSTRLRIAPGLPEAMLLTGELETFQAKITTSANDVYGTWREGVHDDLVLATALAAWYGEHGPVRRPFSAAAGGSRPVLAAYRRMQGQLAGRPERPEIVPGGWRPPRPVRTR